MIPIAFTISSSIWESATFVFLVIPLTLLWVGSIGDTILRKDLQVRYKALWLIVLVPFPVIGTLFYLFRRPGLRERAISVRESRPMAETRQMTVETLDNFAVTMDLTQSMLQQSSVLLDQAVKTLSEAGSTAGFSLPLTHIRPLRPVETRVNRLVTQARVLKVTMERMSLALGINSKDLRNLAHQIDTLGLSADVEDVPFGEQETADASQDGRSVTAPMSDGSVRIAVRVPDSDSGKPTPTT